MTLAKERLKIKASCGCELCDLGHRPDGPAGHEIGELWVFCPLQPRRIATPEEMERTQRMVDDNVKLGRPRKQADRITPLPV